MDDNAPLAGQVALITGGARRIGAELARALHAAGAVAAIHCHRSLAPAHRLAEELNRVRPQSASVHSADLLNIDSLAPLVAAVISRHGRLDHLINNASSFYATPLGSISAAQFDDLLGTNLRAPLFLAQAARAELRRTGGLVLNLVDIHGLRPLKNYALYSSAKAGLIMLTRALARELAPEVRVNAIAPGPVLWAEGENALDAEQQREIIARTPLHRPGSPGDIARAALFFASQAPFITGQILAVDGGRSIGW